MKSQKTTMIAVSICLLAGMTAFSQKGKSNDKKMKMFSKMDANKDGKITKDEVKNKKILKNFDKIDANSDGAITMEELKMAHKKNHKKGKEKHDSKKMFSKIDANKDGKITKDEVKNKKILKNFDKIDANSDGAITMEELKMAHEKNHKKGKEKHDSKKMFSKMDTNNDGKITKDEVKNKKILKNFDKIDANSDGAITMEELKMAHEKRKRNKHKNK